MGLLQIILNIFYCVWVIIKSIGGLQSQTMKVLGQAALSSLEGFVMNLIIYIMLDYAFCRVNMNKTKKTSLLRRLQAQTLPDATPPIGKIYPFP